MLRSLRADERYFIATAREGNSVLFHHVAQNLGRDILQGVECSAIPTNASQCFNVLH